eukprot:4052673-Pleurochrysis_carterae.AAC.1
MANEASTGDGCDSESAGSSVAADDFGDAPSSDDEQYEEEGEAGADADAEDGEGGGGFSQVHKSTKKGNGKLWTKE